MKKYGDPNVQHHHCHYNLGNNFKNYSFVIHSFILEKFLNSKQFIIIACLHGRPFHWYIICFDNYSEIYVENNNFQLFKIMFST